MPNNTVTVESAIRTELTLYGPCTLEALLRRLSQFSWNEVFAAIDRMSREAQLVLRHPTRFDYELSLGQTQLATEVVRAGRDTEGDMRYDHAHPDHQVHEEPACV